MSVSHIVRGLRNLAKKLDIMGGDLEFAPHSFELDSVDSTWNVDSDRVFSYNLKEEGGKCTPRLNPA